MGNTEGSRVISRVYKARKNLRIVLSNDQLAVVVGSVLGDAYIYPQGKVRFAHSSAQRQYLCWKYKVLASVAYPKIAKVSRLDKRFGTKTVSYRFFLRQYFRPLRRLFYRGSKKIIPDSLDSVLCPLTVAIWYMDDGSLDKGKYPLFMTDSYSLEDRQKLIGFLNQSLGISSLNSQEASFFKW